MNCFCRFFSFVLLILIAENLTAQTLFTYGNKPVGKEEFLKAYSKNNTSEKRDEKSLREYLDLYTKFKLKVQAAYELRLDTLPSQKAELQNFRSQLVQNYLNDESSLNFLVDEAFDRSQKDVRISHIFIPANAKDSPAVIQRAKQKIQEAYKQLQAGKDFGQVAMAFSADPGVNANKGDIGYITVFTLPYELESLAYNTPLGKYSTPYQSKSGFHIFKKTAERKAFGKMKVAQVLLNIPADGDNATKQVFKLRADSIYDAAIKGANFGALAEQFSGDNFSYQTKGEMPEFGPGRYSPEFENAAFALQKDGDISKPILTEYGYHIIKRISRTPIPSDKKNKEYRAQLKEQVSNDDRIQLSKKILQQKILKLSGYKKAVYNAKDLWAYTDSILNNKPVPSKTSIRPNTVLFSFTNQKISVNDWIAFRRSTNDVERITGGKGNQQLLDDYVNMAGLEYYKNHLEMFNKDFAFQMKEFKEGNLLFEVMQRNVWDKAASDSVGLHKYFSGHKNNYWWQNSVSGMLFTSSNERNGQDLKQKLQPNIKNWRSIAETYEGTVIADSGRFEVEQLALPADYKFQSGTFTPFIKNQSDTSVSFVYVLNHYPDRSARNFEEARGYVINDYQAYLEEQWINELKKKYPIKVNEAVFKTMIK
jgi:peptidyl-prolyl cis-trans isomerase SurA